MFRKNFWFSNLNKFKTFKLNFGPVHPAAHGVLRLILELNGEFIQNIDSHIGLLHRGTEKLMEYKSYLQCMPYFSRLDYVSMLIQEHTFCMSIEKVSKLTISKRASFIRTIFSEITRILNHLMCLTTHALDVGALTPFLWAFEEREKLMSFYERVSGARIHASYFRPGGVLLDLPLGLLNDIYLFTLKFNSRINEIEELLTVNRLWKQRLINIGIVSWKQSILWGFSGVLLRASNIFWDLRKTNNYEIYDKVNFKIPFGFLKNSSVNKWNPIKFNLKVFMENLIYHFKFYSENLNVTQGLVYTSCESPKGEFGVFLISNNTYKPFRVKIRSPGFFHLQGLIFMAKNHLIADVVTIIGTQDIVFGEIDR